MTAGARSTTAALAGQRPVVTSAAAGRGGPSALAVAWTLLLAVLLALAGYVLWQRHLAPQPEAPTPVPSLSQPLPAPAAPDSGGVSAPAPEATAQQLEDLPIAPRDADEAFAPLAFEQGRAEGASEPAEIPSDGAAAEAEQLALARPSLGPPSLNAPWQRNARSFAAAPGDAVIAVVVAGLGLSAGTTEAAITMLPPEVTLSFTPYSHRLNDWIAMARIFGHEVMLDLPMEAPGAAEAIGPYGLTMAATAADNLARLDWILDRSGALVGVAGAYGERFLSSPAALRPVLAALRARGLVFLDNAPGGHSGSSALAADLGLPFAASDGKIDAGLASRRAVDARLVQAEDLALRRGSAVVMAEALPVSIERISTWLLGLSERGVKIAPITAVARRNLARWDASG